MSGTSNLIHFLRTDPGDLGCEQVFVLLDLYVEREHEYGDAAERYPGLAAHLDACGPCSEDNRGLLALLAD